MQRNYSQLREQEKISGKNNETVIITLTDNKFKKFVITLIKSIQAQIILTRN